MSKISYLKIIIYVVLLVLPGGLLAQFSDNFSDGDLSNSPTWLGDTSKFRVNNNFQLQLHDTEAGNARIFAPLQLNWGNPITLECWVKLGFTPTINNFFRLGLYPSTTDLSNNLTISPDAEKHLVLNASGTADDLSSNFRLSSSTNTFRVKIVYAAPHLEFWLDTLGGATPDFTLVGTSDSWSFNHVFNPQESLYFGIECNYTASRSTSFYFDDILVTDGSEDSIQPHRPTINPGDVLISEILFNPHPSGCDFVELYNATDSTLNTSDLSFIKVNADGTYGKFYPLPNLPMLPHAWYVFCTNKNYVLQYFRAPHPDHVIELSSMPSYNDDQGTVLLSTSDSVTIDRFDYNENMHSRLLHSTEGVTLERRSLSSPTQSANNWYSAASTTALSDDSGWGTPTDRNSQSKEFLFVSSDWSVDLAVFSPDGDGYNDLLDIEYNLSLSDLSANLTIFDAQGRPVRHLLKSALLGTHGNIVWDGTDDQGKRCQRGSYVILVEAFNTRGVSQVSKLTVSLVTN